MDMKQIRSMGVGRGARVLVAAAVLGMAAVATVPVLAQGHRPSHHGPAGAMMMPFAGSPERIDRMVERMLRGLNATETQTAQIQQIARTAATDIQARREAGRGLREQAMSLFTQPTVDANAVEALRQQQIAQMDQVSRRMSQAMVEVSRVLTPEQRLQLAERMKKRARHWQHRPAG